MNINCKTQNELVKILKLKDFVYKSWAPHPLAIVNKLSHSSN